MTISDVDTSLHSDGTDVYHLEACLLGHVADSEPVNAIMAKAMWQKLLRCRRSVAQDRSDCRMSISSFPFTFSYLLDFPFSTHGKNAVHTHQHACIGLAEPFPFPPQEHGEVRGELVPTYLPHLPRPKGLAALQETAWDEGSRAWKEKVG